MQNTTFFIEENSTAKIWECIRMNNLFYGNVKPKLCFHARMYTGRIEHFYTVNKNQYMFLIREHTLWRVVILIPYSRLHSYSIILPIPTGGKWEWEVLLNNHVFNNTSYFCLCWKQNCCNHIISTALKSSISESLNFLKYRVFFQYWHNLKIMFLVVIYM